MDFCWLLQMVDNASFMAHVKKFRACMTLSYFVSDGCVR